MDFISVIMMLSGLGKNKKVLNEACFTFHFNFKYLFQFSINFRFIINYMACVLVWEQLFQVFLLFGSVHVHAPWLVSLYLLIISRILKGIIISF